MDVAPGGVVSLHEAGGGGFGPPERRPLARIRLDWESGQISEDYVRRWYPEQFALLFGTAPGLSRPHEPERIGEITS